MRSVESFAIKIPSNEGTFLLIVVVMGTWVWVPVFMAIFLDTRGDRCLSHSSRHTQESVPVTMQKLTVEIGGIVVEFGIQKWPASQRASKC